MKRILAMLATVGLSMPVVAVDPPDYARVWTLDADSEAGVARVRVTPDIQATLTDSGLGDLVISDADDQRVPFALIEARDLHETLSRQDVLEFSDFTAADAPVEQSAETASLRLDLIQEGHRLLITIPRGQLDEEMRRRPVLEALIGASSVPDELPTRTLSLRLQSLEAARLDCRLRDADRPGERERALSLVDQGERHPYRYSGALPVTGMPRAWHLRCFASAVPEGLKLERAVLLAQGFRDHRRVRVFQPEMKPNGSEVELELPGAYKVREVALATDQANVLADVVVSARNGLNQPWRRLGAGVLSTLPGQAPEENRLALEHRQRHRYWQVRVEPPPSQGMTIEFSAEVEEIAFLPQGQGPWRLYAGSRRQDRVPANRDLVGRTVERLGPAWQWPLASVSGPEEAGGASALEMPPEPLPWRQIVLWVVLGLAASVLIWISVRLLRQSA